mmetsp:Transcript_39937/g.87176  ORF Transcript_39937/g.87176 Transcript_39937/m.87176 type:complete len:216 (-) Transcript_39937:170-817(-)
MCSYSQGVLVHNFNEDRFGIDLQRTAGVAKIDPSISVSHAVHHWKTLSPEDKAQPASSESVERHIFFGHTGDMRDPHHNLQKREFATASQYFLQDPAKIPAVGTLSADGFTLTDDPITKVAPYQSHFAAKTKRDWGTRRQSHSVPATDRFLTEHRRNFQAGGLQAAAAEGLTNDRLHRAYGDFSKDTDSVKLTRSYAFHTTRGGSLRSAAQGMVQ